MTVIDQRYESHSVQGGEVRTDGPQQGLADLLLRVAARDDDAFAEFYQRTHRRVLTSAQQALGGGLMLAEEVSQEVYLQVWTRAHTYRPDRSTPVGWLMMLTRRRSVDRFRSERNAADRDTAYVRREIPMPDDLVAETVSRRLDAEQVRRAMYALSHDQRTLITMVYYREWTHRQAADYLNIPLGTAKSRIRTGILRLASCVGERLP
ncbi:sigma-70 family RNA polymerase sigma factor [Nocardia alni]|uniref:sigma-70 family RNA polymerase sigma factor n=1 Tax=Nocardia alni TaxID=2815723 RepID=UPI001C215225|nr:sigma-70 family RNA polymerase sigma factor [Nocardia alni]